VNGGLDSSPSPSPSPVQVRTEVGDDERPQPVSDCGRGRGEAGRVGPKGRRAETKLRVMRGYAEGFG
jgi:hypothetical protein